MVGDNVLDAVGVLVGAAVGGRERPVSDLDVAFGFPHGQGGVGDVPGAGEPLGRGRGEGRLWESGGGGWAESDWLLHAEIRRRVSVLHVC